jgi:hypothetical protein
MKINVLISGPIRPSEEYVCKVIRTIKEQIDCRIFLLTWTSDCKQLRQEVDYLFETPEPNENDVIRVIHGRTRQQRELNLSDNSPCAKVPTYKMIYGVHLLCEKASPYIRETEKVIRLRTDSIFQFNAEYLQSLLRMDGNQYITKAGSGFDWFALTTFQNLKKVWMFDSIDEYNKFVNDSWNPEDIIKRRIHVPIVLLDNALVDCYILRENGRKHYYH